MDNFFNNEKKKDQLVIANWSFLLANNQVHFVSAISVSASPNFLTSLIVL